MREREINLYVWNLTDYMTVNIILDKYVKNISFLIGF